MKKVIKLDFQDIKIYLKEKGLIDQDQTQIIKINVDAQGNILIHVENSNEYSQEQWETLLTPLEKLPLSNRAKKCLKEARITCLKEAFELGGNELVKFRNFGNKSLSEVQALLQKINLKF